MPQNFQEFLYLKFLIGNFEALYQLYFSNIAYLGPAFRQAGVGILFSLGLAWSGFCFIKAPVDRLLSGIGVLAMVGLSGFLISPTTNTTNLGPGSGTELSVGGYYSFVLAGTILGFFDDMLGQAWSSSIKSAAGQAGPNNDALAMAYRDQAKVFADKFLAGEAKQAVLDYHQKCGAEALRNTTSNDDREILKAAGIGSNTLGMSKADATELMQYLSRMSTGTMDTVTTAASTANVITNPLHRFKVPYEMFISSVNESKAEDILKALPPSASSIDGKKGYRIPTAAGVTQVLSPNPDTKKLKSDAFVSHTSAGGALSKMLPNGAEAVDPKSEEAYVYYPKNCYDLYLVAKESMGNFREAVKDMPEYKNLQVTGTYISAAAAEAVRHGTTELYNEKLKQLGIDDPASVTALENAGDYLYGASTAISNWFDKWMLDYKIPITVSAMAMIVAVLLVTFPIFALASIIFGPKVLVSYAKLMTLPFLVVFINTMFLLMAANMIASEKIFALVNNTFKPGSVDLPSALAKMTAETIAYAVICVAELAIAKFILWDDVRAVTSFNPGNAGLAAAQRGASMMKAVAGLATGFMGGAAKGAAAAKAAKSQQAMSSAITNISQQVSKIANAGGRSMNQVNSRGPSGGGGSSGGGGRQNSGRGSAGNGGNTFGSSGQAGGSSLNPPPKEQ